MKYILNIFNTKRISLSGNPVHEMSDFSISLRGCDIQINMYIIYVVVYNRNRKLIILKSELK